MGENLTDLALRPEQWHENQREALLLTARHLAHHGGDQRRFGNKISLDIIPHINLSHALRSPTIRHRRTGVAIDGLVSGQEQDVTFLQGFDPWVLVHTLGVIGIGACARAESTRPEDVANGGGAGGGSSGSPERLAAQRVSLSPRPACTRRPAPASSPGPRPRLWRRLGPTILLDVSSAYDPGTR
jgi:hypothetical protein